jgi:hypothetical protein
MNKLEDGNHILDNIPDHDQFLLPLTLINESSNTATYKPPQYQTQTQIPTRTQTQIQAQTQTRTRAQTQTPTPTPIPTPTTPTPTPIPTSIPIPIPAQNSVTPVITEFTMPVRSTISIPVHFDEKLFKMKFMAERQKKNIPCSLFLLGGMRGMKEASGSILKYPKLIALPYYKYSVTNFYI